MAKKRESDRVLKFFFGLVSGILLTILYIRFGFELPGIVGVEQRVVSAEVVKTAELDLLNSNASTSARQRALAVVLANQPEKFVEIDSAIGNKFMAEYLRQHNALPLHSSIAPEVIGPVPSIEQLVAETQNKTIGKGLVVGTSISRPSRIEKEREFRSEYPDASEETILFLVDHPELWPTSIVADQSIQQAIDTFRR